MDNVKQVNFNIVGPDTLVFGVDDVAGCNQYLTDYGLIPLKVNDAGGHFEALDASSVVIAHKDDESLPKALESGTMLRKTIYGVANQTTLDDVADELSKDRELRFLDDGSFECEDDVGFTLGFQVTIRRNLNLPAETINSPGAPPQRPVNVVIEDDAECHPRTLSHVVYFVPDVKKAEEFYMKRLGFRCTDRLGGMPFLRPAGSQDHHTLFMIETPPSMQGCEHFTFHMAGPTELMQAGTRFVNKGYVSFWGPGRHQMGSNWFWYFNSPLGCHVEYDADMDIHDDDWIPREMPMNADASQFFLFQHRDNWSPGGD